MINIFKYLRRIDALIVRSSDILRIYQIVRLTLTKKLIRINEIDRAISRKIKQSCDLHGETEIDI